MRVGTTFMFYAGLSSLDHWEVVDRDFGEDAAWRVVLNSCPRTELSLFASAKELEKLLLRGEWMNYLAVVVQTNLEGDKAVVRVSDKYYLLNRPFFPGKRVNRACMDRFAPVE